MAYTNVPTVSVGDLYTADNFNTYLRDNFGAGIPDKFTAKGDIAFGEGADTIGILALGNAGDWLTCDAAETLGVKWAAPTGFFDWFTFGAFTCATLDNLGTTLHYFEITDVATDFGIPDTSARIFLTSLSVIRNGADQLSGETNHYLYLGGSGGGDTNTHLMCRVYGDSNSTSWYWNTQTGLMKSREEDNSVGIYFNYSVGYTMTVKIWGYG